MAAVYKAYQPGVDRIVAIKVLPKQLAADPEFLGRFDQEAKMLAQLQHPHILPVFDYGKANDYTYIVMPLLTNGSLSDRLHGQSLPFTETIKIISQIGDALDYAHSRGVIHRDIKPSNVLLDERNNCLLSDFGIARMYEATSRFTATGGIIGTPAYMSPEQGRGEKIDQRSDIYSLGVVLYELATGRVPYQAETPIAVIFKHIEGPLPPPRTINPNLSQQIEQVILKAMAKNPEDRFATAGEFVQALQNASITNTNKIPATEVVPPPTPLPHLDSISESEDKKTSRWIFIALAGLLLLLIISGLWAIFGRDRDIVADSPPTSTQTALANMEEGGEIIGEADASPAPTQTATQIISDPETSDSSILEPSTETGLADETATPTSLPPSPVPEPTSTPTNIPTPTAVSYLAENLIAYEVEANNSWHILLISPEGEGRRLLPGAPTNNRVANFAPDGEQIAFRAMVNGVWQVFTMRVDGEDLRQITNGSGNNYEANWSPDGKQFAFISDRDGNKELYLMNIDGSNQVRFTINEGRDDDPSWSPDGEWIVFESERNGRSDVYKIRADGSDLTRLTLDRTWNATPAWSLDGEWIAFVSGENGQEHIWIMHPDGSAQRQLTIDGTLNHRPAWSPDSTQIAIASNRDGDMEIWMMKADGSSPSQLTTEGGAINPAWSRK